MRIPTFALGLVTALSLAVVSVPAFAADGAPPPQQQPGGGAHQHLQFPMKAADYQRVMDARIQHAHERMETRIAEKKLAPERAKEARARFDADVVNVRRAVVEACADGQVTRAEARNVNKSARVLRHPMRRH